MTPAVALPPQPPVLEFCVTNLTRRRLYGSWRDRTLRHAYARPSPTPEARDRLQRSIRVFPGPRQMLAVGETRCALIPAADVREPEVQLLTHPGRYLPFALNGRVDGTACRFPARQWGNRHHFRVEVAPLGGERCRLTAAEPLEER